MRTKAPDQSRPLPNLTRQRGRLFREMYKARYIYLMILPIVIYLLIFRYGPMYGIIIAFKEFRLGDGIVGSAWAAPWYKWFERVFRSPDFPMVLRNSILLNIYSLVFQFPIPIILALLLNEVANRFFKKTVQTVLYLPHFLSWVILGGIVIQMLSPSTGIINQLLVKPWRGEGIYFLADRFWWVVVYIVSGIWKEAGWGTIIYLAAISNVDAQLYEAARIDGANKWRQTWHITLPAIRPTIVILLIMRTGSMINVGFDQVWILGNDFVRQVSEVFSVFTFRMGIERTMYSFTTAVGLFQSIVNLILLSLANFIAKRLGENGIW